MRLKSWVVVLCFVISLPCLRVALAQDIDTVAELQLKHLKNKVQMAQCLTPEQRQLLGQRIQRMEQAQKIQQFRQQQTADGTFAEEEEQSSQEECADCSTEE